MQFEVLVPTHKKVRFKALRERGLMGLVRRLPALPFSVVLHARFHRCLRTFRRPDTYNELITHKKLYRKDPIYSTTADKYAVRAYVADRVGEEFLVPLKQVVDRAVDLDFEQLSGRVVIKGTHGCEMTMALDADSNFDRAAVVTEADRWLHTNWYDQWKEWAYREIPPRLVVEEFIGSDGRPPDDFKFHTFHGKVEMIQVDSDRFVDHRSSMFDTEWNLIDIVVAFGEQKDLPRPPSNLSEMIDIAERLAADFDHVRVDLYNVDGRIYFGELTHYPGAGIVAFDPPAFDEALGELWRNGTPIPERFKTSTRRESVSAV